MKKSKKPSEAQLFNFIFQEVFTKMIVYKDTISEIKKVENLRKYFLSECNHKWDQVADLGEWHLGTCPHPQYQY